MRYQEKVVMSGKILEYYRYSKPIFRGFKKNEKDKEKIKLDEESKTDPTLSSSNEKRDDNIIRAKTKIKRLVNSNSDMNKFVTLTFRKNITDIEIANKYFTNFIKKLKYKYLDLKYLVIPEFQKRGAVHYHLLCNLNFIPNKKLSEIWGHGFIKINRIKNVSSIGSYVSKYLTKDIKMSRKKNFFYSKNLNLPQEFVDKVEVENLSSFYNLPDSKPEYETIFSNEYVGNVEYKQFNLEKLT